LFWKIASKALYRDLCERSHEAWHNPRQIEKENGVSVAAQRIAALLVRFSDVYSWSRVTAAHATYSARVIRTPPTTPNIINIPSLMLVEYMQLLDGLFR